MEAPRILGRASNAIGNISGSDDSVSSNNNNNNTAGATPRRWNAVLPCCRRDVRA